MSTPDTPIFDAVVRIDKLPAGGRSIKVDADPATCVAIAARMNVTSVEHFKAELTVAPLRGGLRALGKISARIVQPSVVSFEPVSQDIAETVDRVFLPAGPEEQHAPGSEVFVDLEDDDFPDHIDGAEVDLSELLLETLALAIDAYPRQQGESLESLGVSTGDGESGPFAALSRLKGAKKSDD